MSVKLVSQQNVALLEKIKQILVYIEQENIGEEQMGMSILNFRPFFRHKLLYQILAYNIIESVKLPPFLLSEVPSFLCRVSGTGDLENLKQIFSYFNRVNISVEEMGVKNNEVNKGKKPRLVDCKCYTHCFGKTPLISAASLGHHQICEYLITEQNANLEARDDGQSILGQSTALISAVKSSYKVVNENNEVIRLLLQHKADVKAVDEYGGHAAYIAACDGNIDALMMLMENDRDVINLKGPNGETPLIAASRKGYVDLCKYLVEEKNANINLEDDDGKNALQHATDPEIIAAITEKMLRSKSTE